MASNIPRYTDEQHLFLLNCMNALDPNATLWARPTVTMDDRVAVVLADDHDTNVIYSEVMEVLMWLRNQGRIKEDYTMCRGDVADLLSCTHPDAPVIYPK